MDSATLGSEATLIGGGTVNGNLVITGDLTVQGNFNFGDAGVDILTIAGYIQGSASGNTSVNIGAGTPASMTPTTDSFYVTGDSEFDGQIYSDGNLRANNNLVINSNIVWGGLSTGTRAQIRQSGSFDQLLWALGSDLGNQLVIGSALYNTRDYDHALTTDPTVFIQSVTDPNSDNTEWMSLTHDQADPVIGGGKGRLKLDSLGLQNSQGADVASATNIAVGSDGNVFELTGTTKVDLISNVGWQEGSEIMLVANENVTIDHGTATATTNVTILLAGAGDYAMTANDTLTLVLCSTTANGQAWREKSRAVI